jgi:zinc protease
MWVEHDGGRTGKQADCAIRLCRPAVLTILVPLLGAAEALALNEKLSNGVTLQTVHPARATGVQIRLLVPAGGRDDPRGREGLAHYVEHLLASDPGPLSPGGTSDSATRLSAHGYANAFTWPAATVYAMNVGRESLESALSLLAGRLSQLDASDAMAERERRIVQQEYFLRYGANPSMRLMAELRTKIGRVDPTLGWNIGTPDSIKTFDLPNAQSFFERWYRPQSMTLVLSGLVDIDTVREVAERTIGLIPARPALSSAAMSKNAGAAPANPPSLVLERDDPDAAVPTVVQHHFVRTTTGAAASVIREHAAMLVLQDLLTWKAARKSILAGVHDPHARTMSATITRLDRLWMILAATVETDPAARRTAIGGLVTGRLAAVTERDVPDQLVTEFRDLADRTWVFAEDAPNADDVINWLRMGFSLEERGHLRAALESLTKKDVVAFAHKVAKPDASATGFLRTGK